MYVVTNYYCDQWYCGFSPSFNDTSYFRDQLAIARGLKQLCASKHASSITVKLPPMYDGDYEPPWTYELRGAPNVRFVGAEKSFQKLLLEHDAVLIDSPTTTLLEALSTDIPVFVLTAAVRWPDESLAELSRRAVCDDDPDRLVEELGGFIRTGLYPADRADRAFLRKYGTHFDDGRSAERGAGAVLTVIANGTLSSACFSGDVAASGALERRFDASRTQVLD